MKLRQVMVVEPMRSTRAPKKGAERPMTRRMAMTRDRKTTRFQPKAAKEQKLHERVLHIWYLLCGMLRRFSNSWLGGFIRMGKAVMRWTKNRTSTTTFTCAVILFLLH
jgi:hypothetical protein